MQAMSEEIKDENKNCCNHKSLNKLTPEEYIKVSEQNHCYINAFSAISPSDEFLRSIGKWVLDKLNESQYKSHYYFDGHECITIGKEVVLTLNMS